MKGRPFMKKRNNIAFLSLLLAAGLLLGACGQNQNSSSAGTSESSSSDSGSDSSSSHTQGNKFTVTFKVEGEVVQTIKVNEGELAVYTGATPTKQADAEASKYIFRSWDKDIFEPIVADTEFNALFSGYANEVMVDDFEDYEDTPTMLDAGWQALGYDNTSKVWNDATKATVSLGHQSVEGNNSLRFDAWENDVGYKIAKTFEPGTYNKAANALKFRLMAPSLNVLKIIIEARVKIQGTEQAPRFTYTTKPISSDFVEYTIPLADEDWALWGEAGKSIHSVAEWTGFHEDTILNYLSAIEFYVQGVVSGNPAYVAYLDSVRFVTLDNPASTQVDEVLPFDRYTGTTDSGEVVRFDINEDNSATAKILTLREPVTIPGAVVFNDHSLKFTSSDNGQTLTYEVQLTNGGQLGKFLSSTGTYRDEFYDMDIKSVQIVDNFDQYTEDGLSYYQGNMDINNRRGARGAYYSEYYTNSSSTSSPWGGNKWSLMGGNGDQLKLKQDSGAHSGNQYICLKNSPNGAMRYMQWDLFADTAEHNIFRGTTMGFWAKTSGIVKKFHVYMYSQTSPTNDTRDNSVRKVTFEETEAIADWKHYEIALNPDLVYYGYMIVIEVNGQSSESYLYVDDVEVYGADPYAHFVPPAPAMDLVPDTVYTAKYNDLYNLKLIIQEDNQVKLTSPGLGIDELGTYSMEAYDTVMTFGGVKYKAVLSEDGKTFTYSEVTGTGTVATVLTNTNFNMVDYAENAETYAENGKMYSENNLELENVYGAAGAYYCDLHNNGDKTSPIGGEGWQLFSGTSDPIRLDTSNKVDGKQSIQFKNSSWGQMRYLQWDLYTGNAKPHTGVDTFNFSLRNAANRSVGITVMVFKTQQVTQENYIDANRVVSEKITFDSKTGFISYSMKLDPTETYYGFGIILDAATASESWINLDLAYFSNSESNPNLNFYGKKDVALNGSFTTGAASFTFGEGDKIYLSCAAESLSNVEGKYEMYMDGDDQMMTIKVGNTTITGTYSIDATGKITFTVTEKTGDLAGKIDVSAVFSNQ